LELEIGVYVAVLDDTIDEWLGFFGDFWCFFG
jgi:hypothetical protein